MRSYLALSGDAALDGIPIGDEGLAALVLRCGDDGRDHGQRHVELAQARDQGAVPIWLSRYWR